MKLTIYRDELGRTWTTVLELKDEDLVVVNAESKGVATRLLSELIEGKQDSERVLVAAKLTRLVEKSETRARAQKAKKKVTML